MTRRLSAFALLLCLLACSLTACQTPGGRNPAAFTDDTGREFTVSSPAKVAVCSGSLAGIWQLAGGSLAAVTEDAFDEPDLLLDGAVNLGSVKEPNLETLLDCEPDFAILSANISGHFSVGETLAAANIPYALFEVETFEDYLRVLELFTRITGRTDLYEKNGASLQAEVNSIVSAAEGKPAPRVLLIRAYSTGAKAKGSDSMVGAMLRDLGCINIADGGESLLTDLSLERILEEDPDFIFLTTMGSAQKAAEAFEESFTSHPAWQTLTAVKEGRFYLLEKELFHLKPNARWPESYRILYSYLYGKETF